MSDAFVDTSIVIAIASQELGFTDVKVRLAVFDAVYCSDLLFAEFRSVCRREA